MAKLTDTQITALAQAASVTAAELKEFRAPTVKRLVTDGLVVQTATEGLYRVTGLGVQTLDDLGLGEGVAQANRPEVDDSDDPIVAVQMNRKDRRDEGRAKRRFSRRVAKVRDQRQKKWGGQVTINLQHLAA